MIKYLGSKRRLITEITTAIASFPSATSVTDLFSGTSRVGHALKRAGYQVFANDHNSYAATLARCYVQCDRERWERDATELIARYNAISGAPGFVTESYAIASRYFQERNAMRIDAIREAIAEDQLPMELEAILLVALMEAADRVDSTTGVQMAYLKQWSKRSYNDLVLRLPELLPQAVHGPGYASQLEAIEAAAQLHADVTYLDPPYNQHSYLGNYHIWESLVRWDRPELYGIANKRVDVRERKSPFNSKRAFADAFRLLLSSLTSPAMVISFSNEGFLEREEMEEMLRSLYGGCARVRTLVHDYPRYVGAQIGIHNPQGERVGKVSHLRNNEYLFLVAQPDYPSIALAEEIVLT